MPPRTQSGPGPPHGSSTTPIDGSKAGSIGSPVTPVPDDEPPRGAVRCHLERRFPRLGVVRPLHQVPDPLAPHAEPGVGAEPRRVAQPDPLPLDPVGPLEIRDPARRLGPVEPDPARGCRRRRAACLFARTGRGLYVSPTGYGSPSRHSIDSPSASQTIRCRMSGTPPVTIYGPFLTIRIVGFLGSSASSGMVRLAEVLDDQHYIRIRIRVRRPGDRWVVTPPPAGGRNDSVDEPVHPVVGGAAVRGPSCRRRTEGGKVTGPNGSRVPSTNWSQAVARAGGSGSGAGLAQAAGRAEGRACPAATAPRASGADRSSWIARCANQPGPEGSRQRATAPDHVDGLGVLVPVLDVEEGHYDALVGRPVGDDRAGLEVRAIGGRRQDDGACEEAAKDEAGDASELTERNDTSVGRSGFQSVPGAHAATSRSRPIGRARRGFEELKEKRA